MTEYGWERDEWLALLQRVRAAGILLIAGPVFWLGDILFSLQHIGYAIPPHDADCPIPPRAAGNAADPGAVVDSATTTRGATMATTLDRFQLAQAHLDGGDALQALETLAPLHDELDGHRAGQLLLGRAYYHSAQLGRARATLERLVELEPTDHYARFLLGRTLERQGRPAEAVTHYQIAAAMSARPEYRERLELVKARPQPDSVRDER